MQVETFECHETAAEPIEATEEAIALIESLGLDGQRELVATTDESQFGKRCPYREITKEERFVYRTLCPTQVSLERYNAAPIPLRILQVAAHAKSLDMFRYLMVWDKEQDEIKDPVLLGFVGQYDFSPEKVFILARWGSVLEPFHVLKQQALAMHRQNLLQDADKRKKEVEAATDADIMSMRPVC